MNTIIKTIQQLHQAQADAWVYGMIVCGIALALAIVIAFIVPFRSDFKDYVTRRVCFILAGLVFPAAYWLYNMQVIVPKISNPGFKSMFEKTNLTVLLASIGAYFIIGIVLMLVFRKTKFGSILGKEKN